jgi:hypothetical protein
VHDFPLLDLSFNSIGDDGCTAIASLLAENNSSAFCFHGPVIGMIFSNISQILNCILSLPLLLSSQASVLEQQHDL